MRLVQFTRTSPAGAPVSVNPELVAAVITAGDKTVIQFAAPNGDGSLAYYVQENYDHVVAALQGEAIY